MTPITTGLPNIPEIALSANRKFWGGLATDRDGETCYFAMNVAAGESVADVIAQAAIVARELAQTSITSRKS